MATNRRTRSQGCGRTGHPSHWPASASVARSRSRLRRPLRCPGHRAPGRWLSARRRHQLEVFSWWTTGGEAAGLDQLFAAFYGGLAERSSIVNAAVAGGGGSNAKTALQTRLGGGQAPDSWQSHLGKELQSTLRQIPATASRWTDLYTEQGWNDVFPQGVIDQATINGSTVRRPRRQPSRQRRLL